MSALGVMNVVREVVYPEGWDFEECLEIGPLCPVEETTLGYFPILWVNALFCAIFAICAAFAITVGVMKKTWSFSIAIFAACTLETVGYIGRVLMNSNPWENSTMMMQLCCIILAPTLFCVGIYLTMKHTALAVGPQISRIQPKLYTWIFVTADIICLVIQAAGGGIAATAEDNISLGNIGEKLMLSGIIIQVCILSIFGALFVDFWLRARSYYSTPQRRSEMGYAIWIDKNFRLFFGAIMGAYWSIWVRSVYRIAELAQGWRSAIMRDQTSFIILEGAAIVLAAIFLAFFPPGILFPQMGNVDLTKMQVVEGEELVGRADRSSDENPTFKPYKARGPRR